MGDGVGECCRGAETVGEPFPFPETAFLKLPLGLPVGVTYLETVPRHILQGRAVPLPGGHVCLRPLDTTCPRTENDIC